MFGFYVHFPGCQRRDRKTSFFPGQTTLAVFWQVRSTLALVEATLGLNSTGNVVTPLVQRLVFQAGSRGK